MKKILIILTLLAMVFLTGCFVIPDDPIPEPPIPVTSIYIEPEYSEIALGESVELACFDQLDRPVLAAWSKRCGAGTLSVEVGETCVYSTPLAMTGIQEIYVDFKGLEAVAKVNGVRRNIFQ